MKNNSAISYTDRKMDGLEGETNALMDAISTSLDKKPASLLLKNCQLVNVCSGEIYSTDIAIQGNRIVSISPDAVTRAEETIDCDGFYAVPGFAEPHMHMETTYVAPAELARVLVPKGTTTLIYDLTDCAYVAGVKSARMMMDETKNLPWRVFAESPSYTPYMPSMTTGGTIGLEDVQEILAWPETVSIGQVVHQNVLDLDEEYIKKFAAYRMLEKRICGQTSGLSPHQMDAISAGGINADLSCYTYDDIVTRLRTGLKLQLVEAPGRRNLKRMMQGVVRHGTNTRNLCFCVDDTSIFDIVSEDSGYLDVHVRIALKAGVPPVEVFQMASFNTASFYGKDHLLGSITPGRLADILLLHDLDQFPPAFVIVDGKIVARDGVPLWEREPRSYPKWALKTIKFHSSITEERFSIPAPQGASSAQVRVIHFSTPDAGAFNEELITKLPVQDGFVQADFERDIIPFYVVERYGKNGNVACSFVKGSGLKKGAIASSMNISDGNVVVIGCDPISIMTCLNAIKDLNGGFVVAQDDQVLASIPLQLLGQMAIQPYEEMLAQFEEALNSAQSLHCTLNNPFATISATVLPTVPALGMSDYGLINAYTGELLETVIEWL
jgi:adenine deaminase